MTDRWPTPLDLEDNRYSPMEGHRHHPHYRMISTIWTDYLYQLMETDMDDEWDDWCDAHYKEYLHMLDAEPYGHIQPWDWESLGVPPEPIRKITISREEALWLADRMIELAYRNDTLAESLEESDDYKSRLTERASECRQFFKTIETRLDFDIEATWD